MAIIIDMKRKRLTKAEKDVVRTLAPRPSSLGSPLSREVQDHVRARRAFVAGMMLKRYTIAEMQLTLAKPVVAGGMNVWCDDQIIYADIKEVRKDWADRTKDAIKNGIQQQTAVLDKLESIAMERLEAGEHNAATALLAVHDRKVALLGLDLATRQKLMLDGNGPLTVTGIQDVLARAKKARQDVDREDTVDVTADVVDGQ